MMDPKVKNDDKVGSCCRTEKEKIHLNNDLCSRGLPGIDVNKAAVSQLKESEDSKAKLSCRHDLIVSADTGCACRHSEPFVRTFKTASNVDNKSSDWGTKNNPCNKATTAPRPNSPVNSHVPRNYDILDYICGAPLWIEHLKSVCESNNDRLAQAITGMHPEAHTTDDCMQESSTESRSMKVKQPIRRMQDRYGRYESGNEDDRFCRPCNEGKFPVHAFLPRHFRTLKQRYVRSTIYCGGICCAAEIPAVRCSLEAVPGVDTFHVNVALRQVAVDHDPETISAQELLAYLSDVGATTVLKDGGAIRLTESAMVTSKFSVKKLVLDVKEKCPLIQSFSYNKDNRILAARHAPLAITASQIAKQLGVSVVHDGTVDLFRPNDDSNIGQGAEKRFPRPTVIISGVLWIMSLLSMVGGGWSHLKWVALLSISFGIPPIGFKAFQSLKRWRCDTNCLMFFASLGAIGLQDYTEAAAVVFLFALSEWLELRASSRARTALLSIIQLKPDVADAIVGGELVTVPASMVPVGTLVSVKAGAKIPCDGVIEEGTSFIDESSLTGESRPISKVPGSLVAGGTLNCGVSPLTIKTTASAENSAVSRLIRLVEEAQANRSTTEKSVDRFAAIYTPAVVLGALAMCTIPWFFDAGTGRHWTRNGLVLLVVACPCALIISTPVSYVAGLAATASRGLLIKGGAHLEILAAVRCICFDKTGTLTNGKFALLDLQVVGESFTRQEVFEYLLAMEEKASHPVAQAIIAAARNEKVENNKSLSLTKHRILEGEGVEGLLNGRKVFVGNERLFRRIKYSIPSSNKASTGFMGVEGHGVVCRFTAADAIRPEAAQVITSLKLLGIESIMLTGDNHAAARTVGDALGLDRGRVKSELLPEGKFNLIKEISKDLPNTSCYQTSRLMMVGDGVNDAPALAIADVGVAMGEGAALSMETADITLLDSDLRKLEYGIRMGRRVARKIVENVVFSIAVKAAVLVLALLGRAELWAAISVDVGAMLVVTLNAMALLPRKDKKFAASVKKTSDGFRVTL